MDSRSRSHGGVGLARRLGRRSKNEPSANRALETTISVYVSASVHWAMSPGEIRFKTHRRLVSYPSGQAGRFQPGRGEAVHSSRRTNHLGPPLSGDLIFGPDAVNYIRQPTPRALMVTTMATSMAPIQTSRLSRRMWRCRRRWQRD